MFIKFILIFGTFTVLGCAPKPEPNNWKKPRTVFGPTRKDTDIVHNPNGSIRDLKLFPLLWEGVVTPAKLFRTSENLVEVAKSSGQDPLIETSKLFVQNLMTGLRRKPSTRKFTDSFYIQLVAQEAPKVVLPSLSKTIAEANSDMQIVTDEIANMGQSFKLNNYGTLKENVELTFKFARRIENQIDNLKLQSNFKSTLKKQFLLEIRNYRDSLDQPLAEISAANTLTEVLAPLRRLELALKVQWSPQIQDFIEKGQSLGRKIDFIKNGQDALGVLVDFWRLTDIGQRLQYIQPVNRELYDYLNKQNEQGLSCLQDPNCNNFAIDLAKKMVIFPKINEFGIENMRQTMNFQSMSWALKQINQSAYEVLVNFPQKLINIVNTQFNSQLTNLLEIFGNFNPTFKSRMNQWFEKTFSADQLNYFDVENYLAHLKLNDDNTLHLVWSDQRSFDLESFGSYLAFLPSYWRLNIAVGPVNTATQFSVIDDLGKEWQNLSPQPEQLSADSFSEILRGYSRLVQFFDVEKVNIFDRELGKHSFSELFPEFSFEMLKLKVFPKDELLALILAQISNHLNSLFTNDSQLFLIDSRGKIIWLNDFNLDLATQVFMAGIVDRLPNEQEKIVRAEDVSRFILALTEFIRSTNSLEISSSAFLQRVLPGGKRVLELLVDTRKKIRFLIIALGNYLSRQFKVRGEFIAPVLSIVTQKPNDSQPLRLEDQLLAIRAFLEISDTVDLPIYKWEALDLYFLLNQKMFNQKLSFYGDNEVDLPLLLETLRTLNSIKLHLSGISLEQAEILLDEWRKSLEGLALSND